MYSTKYRQIGLFRLKQENVLVARGFHLLVTLIGTTFQVSNVEDIEDYYSIRPQMQAHYTVPFPLLTLGMLR